MRNIILSIYHRHAENILTEKKDVELRKALPRAIPGKVYLYDTQEKKIVGYFVPAKLVKASYYQAFYESTAGLIWERAAITKKEFQAYYANEDRVRYYEINFSHRLVNPISLPTGIRAPQNFVYCGELHEECECGGTGFIGDNGPGITGNTEYCACDQCPAGEGK